MDSGKNIPFAFPLPEGYDPDKTYPVVLGPGDGTPGGDGCAYWRGDFLETDWIRIENMAFSRSDRVKATRVLLHHLMSRFKVEGNRFHMVGFSANSAGAFQVVLALPELFQHVTVIPGYPRTEDDMMLKRLKGIWVQFIVGAADTGWLTRSRAYHKSLTDMGVGTKLDVVKGGHILKDLFGAPFMSKLGWGR